MPEVYVFAGGKRVVGLSRADVVEALTVAKLYGLVHEDAPNPLDAMARAIFAALGSRARRESDEALREHWHNQGAANIRLALETAKSRTRAHVEGREREAVRRVVRGEAHGTDIGSRLS